MDHTQLRRRIIKACTACKQSKVRCDADGKVGKTCTRCRMRGLECEVDAHFKRTPVRERMKAMAAELKQLRQTVKEGETSPLRRPSHQFTGIDSESNNAGLPSPNPEPFQNPLSMAPQRLDLGEAQDNIAVQSTSFGPIVFSVEEIQECFRIFNECFHRHVPILDQSISIGTLQQCSPVLFKTVLVIVCQRFRPTERNQHEFQIVAEVYQQMLNQSMLTNPLSLHTIQAILLICVWPLPTSSQLAEPSWLYCGVAMNAASYLNLGRPTLKPLYQGAQLSSNDVRNMSRTWLAVFIISTNIATFIGAPLPFKHPSDLTGVETRISKADLPRGMAAHAALAVVVSKHAGILTTETDVGTHAALVAMHSEELDGVYRRYQDIWDDDLEFFLQATKLHFRTSLWIRDCNASNRVDATPRCGSSSEILIAATASATSLIQIYQRLVVSLSSSRITSTTSNGTTAAIMPKNYFRCLIHATAFLLRFVCFNKTVREDDRETARRHIDMAAATLKMTVRDSNPKDDMARAGTVLGKLLEHGEQLQEQRLQIDDRGGASIYWDTIHKSLQIRGIPTARTDLLELIDPTRNIKSQSDEKAGRRDSHLPTPSITSAFASEVDRSEPGVIWDDSLMEFFDLNRFDVSDFGGPLVS